MKKRITIILVGLCSLSFLVHFAFLRNRVRIIELPKGELQWSTHRPSNASLCVPAAYSENMEGVICGQYNINGYFGTRMNRLHFVSLKDNSFILDKKWHSSVGFQQHALVYNSKVRSFSDSRKSIRRALCKKNGRAFILESYYPMTLSAFARECGKHATDALNLDMGIYGFGYYSWHNIKLPLSPWAFFWKKRQSNWLYITE